MVRSGNDADARDAIMNEQIFETVVTTCSPAGAVHVAPMGVRYVDDRVVLKPFRPSTTLDNILASGTAVLNLLTDVRVFAGCVTGRRTWPTVDAHLAGEPRAVRLATALEHVVLRLESRDDDAQRPTLRLVRLRGERHAAYPGFNRAQAAVIEGAVLVSRLHLLPRAKIESEMAYLQIAIDKTAGPSEHEAWGWLREAVARATAPVQGRA
jgi:hypothetical protein